MSLGGFEISCYIWGTRLGNIKSTIILVKLFDLTRVLMS